MKKIPLTQGKYALVDDCDYEYLRQWKWHFHPHGYAIRSEHLGYRGGQRKKRNIRMHVVINKTPRGMKTDHRDGNGLNNRRRNLRNATQSQNQMNSGSRKSSSSKYKGVCWKPSRNRWRVTITVNGKQKYIGVFKAHEEERAALAYNAAAIKLHGKFARLNIIGV